MQVNSGLTEILYIKKIKNTNKENEMIKVS